MEIQNLIDKIQKLVNHRRIGYSKEEDRDCWQITRFRDSFRHKHQAVFFHLNMIKQIKKEIADIIEQQIHGKNEFLFGDKNMKEKIAFRHQIQFKCTVLMEDILYHLTSIIDNLPKIIGVYFKTVHPELGFRIAKSQLNHEHTKDLEITKLINKNWDEWIEKLKKFRGEIFHHHSEICEAQMQASFGRDEKGYQYFKEDIIVNVPKELKEVLKYSEDKVELERFCEDIITKSYNFFDEIFDILIKEHEKIVKKT